MTAQTQSLQREAMHPVVDQVEWATRGGARIPFPITDEALTTGTIGADLQTGFSTYVPTPPVIRIPFTKDPDSGPERAWFALGRHSDFEEPFPPHITNTLKQLYSWGYVFWDVQMLQDAGFENIHEEDRLASDPRFIIPPGYFERASYSPLGKYESNHAAEILLLSRHQKQVMRKRGLTGYFDFEAFRESLKGRLRSNLPWVPEGIMGQLLDGAPEDHGPIGLSGYVRFLMGDVA